MPKRKADALLEEYKYEPLEGPLWIRVIQLQPAARFEDDLVCRIVHLNRETSPASTDPKLNQYSAVSYVWGPRDFSSVLFCELDAGEHTTMKITPNVEKMLRRFRDYAKSLNLWIDAICLNQKDHDEIQEQLFQISSIFESCEHTRVWLGDDDKDIADVFKVFRVLALNPVTHYNDTIHRGPVPFRVTTKEEQARRADTFAKVVTSGKRTKILQFFLNSWFSRRWVLQEFYSSLQVTFCCNKSLINWSTLNKAVRVLLRNSNMFHWRDHTRSVMNFITNDRNEKGNLLEILWHRHSTDCTDPRDRIFALLPLTADKMTGRLRTLRYDQHAHEIYAQIAKMFATSTYLSTVLGHAAAFGRLQDADPKYSSWIPNWAHSRRDADLVPSDSHSGWLYMNENEEVSSEGFPKLEYFRAAVATENSLQLRTVQPAIVVRKVVRYTAEPTSWSEACEMFNDMLFAQGFPTCKLPKLVELIVSIVRKDKQWNKRWEPKIRDAWLEHRLLIHSFATLLENDSAVARGFENIASDINSFPDDVQPGRPRVKELAKSWYDDMCAHIAEFYADSLKAWQHVLKTHGFFCSESFMVRRDAYVSLPTEKSGLPIACLLLGIASPEMSPGDFFMAKKFDFLTLPFENDAHSGVSIGARLYQGYNLCTFKAALSEGERTVSLDGEPVRLRSLTGHFRGYTYALAVSATMDTIQNRPGLQIPERQHHFERPSCVPSLPSSLTHKPKTGTHAQLGSGLPTTASSITIV